MASRRDQFQAYRFLSRRQAAALVGDDSDSAEGPMRRMSGSVTASVMVALLVVAAVGLFGLFRPGGSTAWQDGKSLILERESGTRYVYLGGTLHPVLNYASARLILRGGAGLVQVSRSSLAHTPHGAPVGIPGAPDSLPTASGVVTSAWTACSAPATDQTGQPHPIVRVGTGRPAGATAVPSGGGLLVRDQAGNEYLVWNGRRLRISAGGYAPTALGYAASQPLPVGEAWINVLPQGPDLQAPVVDGIGGDGPELGDRSTTVGQVFQTGGEGNGYVMFPDGLAPVTALQVRLLLASPAIPAAYHGAQVRALPLTQAELAQAPKSASSPATNPLPAQPPALVDTSTSTVKVCASLSTPDADPSVSTVPAQQQTVPGSAGVPVDALGTPVADGFDLAPGQGALVRARPAPGVTTGTLYLISDQGVKFPLTGTDVADDLGLKGVTPTPMPVGMLQLFPTGPSLDEQAAAQTIPVAPATPSATPSG